MRPTTSPARRLLTPSPTSTTSQQNSWPITVSRSGSNVIGAAGSAGALVAAAARRSRGISAPCWTMCRSLPQIPQASTLVSTWPGPGVGSGRSSTRSCQSRMIAARMAATLGAGAARTRSSAQACAPIASTITCERGVGVDRRSARRSSARARSRRLRRSITVWPRVSSPVVSIDDVRRPAGEQVGWVSAITAQRIVHGRAAMSSVAADVGAAEEVEQVGEDRRRRRPGRARTSAIRSGVAWNWWVRSSPAHDQRAAVAEDDRRRPRGRPRC